MNSPLYFPDANTMTQYLSNHPLLKTDFYQENGITKAISELAAERFANSEKVEMGVIMGIMLLMHDLHEGKDAFTGKSLPNLGKLGMPSIMWAHISESTQKALLDCANKV